MGLTDEDRVPGDTFVVETVQESSGFPIFLQ